MARWAMVRQAVPEFVFEARRHPGIRLLVVGGRTVVIVTRHRAAGERTAVRERAWWAKQVAAAGRRVDGTVRNLRQPQRFTNGRGRSLEIDPAAFDWTGLVIVDHPGPPAGVELVRNGGRVPVSVMLRRDWEFVLHELRSAAAVVRYLDWCAGRESGEVPAAFAWLAFASLRHPRRLPLPAAKPLLRHVLPGHAVIGLLLDHVASTPLPDALDEPGRHRLLFLVDEFPLDARTALGEWATDSATARVRTFRFADGIPQYVFAVIPELSDAWSAAFDDLVQLRHHEARDQVADPGSLCTFGVVLTPGGGRWPWPVAHFTCLQGPVTLTESELAEVREFWSETVS